MRKYFMLILLLLSFVTAFNQQISANPAYRLITSGGYVTAKNYYLLNLLQENKAARQFIEQDTVLGRLLKKKIDELSASLAGCNNDIECFTAHMSFSEDEINRVSTRLVSLYTNENILGVLVQQHLVLSGCYNVFEQLTPKELLAKAWEQDARGINFAISVYAAGKKPNYPNIDSVSFDIRTSGYARLLYDVQYLVLNECKNKKLFFLPSLTAVLRLLEINEREQAGDYEPMATGENKAAIERIKSVNWKAYKYSVIMIPGAGPEESAVALSAEGMIRCRLAAIQYQNGLAPFIVTSGGKVHPYKTKYCEAVEMKKFLVDKLHIPANAILIDPHARHTTTNMRNTARLIYRYGIPFTKAAITCTTHGQSNMIESTLLERCLKELHEMPYRNGVRLSETEMEFYPLAAALYINPYEPMDP